MEKELALNLRELKKVESQEKLKHISKNIGSSLRKGGDQIDRGTMMLTTAMGLGYIVDIAKYGENVKGGLDAIDPSRYIELSSERKSKEMGAKVNDILEKLHPPMKLDGQKFSDISAKELGEVFKSEDFLGALKESGIVKEVNSREKNITDVMDRGMKMIEEHKKGIEEASKGFTAPDVPSPTIGRYK